MSRAATIAACFLLLASAAMGSIDVGHLAIQRYMGEPYVGGLEVQVILPGDPPKGSDSDSGTGSARIVDEGNGRARLVVSGTIDGGENGFTVSGAYDETGWRSDDDGPVVEISPDGRISGEGRQGIEYLTLEGTATDEAFDLVVLIELLAPTENGVPAGTMFRFIYDLDRSLDIAEPRDPPPSTDSSGGSSGDECDEIVWRTRNVANPFGTMQMVQVPVCVE